MELRHPLIESVYGIMPMIPPTAVLVGDQYGRHLTLGKVPYPHDLRIPAWTRPDASGVEPHAATKAVASLWLLGCWANAPALRS